MVSDTVSIIQLLQTELVDLTLKKCFWCDILLEAHLMEHDRVPPGVREIYHQAFQFIFRWHLTGVISILRESDIWMRTKILRYYSAWKLLRKVVFAINKIITDVILAIRLKHADAAASLLCSLYIFI